jgi:hypothetical protein
MPLDFQSLLILTTDAKAVICIKICIGKSEKCQIDSCEKDAASLAIGAFQRPPWLGQTSPVLSGRFQRKPKSMANSIVFP